MFKEEWKQLIKNRMFRVMLVGVAVIPLIYGAVFLKSMWDPYGNLQDLPVAIVNEDESVKLNGRTMNVGKEFVENLKASKSMDFHFVGKEKAEQEIKKGNYFMMVEIPSDFSKSAASLQTKNPQKMKLDYTTTAGYNFVAMKMSESAVSKMKDELNAKISTVYMKTVFEELKSVGSGMQQAANGSEKITENLKKAESGVTELSDGSKQLVDGSQSLNEGVQQYTNGANQFVDKLGDVKNGSQKLANGSTQLVQGVEQAKNGTKELHSGLNELNGNSNKLNNGADTLSKTSSQLSDGTKQVADGASQLSEGANTLNEKTGELSDGLQTLSKGAKDLSGGFNTLNNAVENSVKDQEKLLTTLQAAEQSAKSSGDTKTAMILALTIAEMQKSESTKNLQSAVGELQQGASQLSSGLETACTGATQLKQGTEQLSNKTTELSTGASKVSVGSKALNQGASQLQEGVNQYTNGVAQANNGSEKLEEGATTLGNGANTLSNSIGLLNGGIGQLTKASQPLKTNGEKLKTGSQQLTTGTAQLVGGADELTSGLSQLENGSDELTSKLSQGSAKVISQSKPTDEELSQLVTPVITEHTEKTPVKNNGTGMSPYMISIGLWVGSLAMCIAFDLLKKSKNPKFAFEWWGAKFSVLYLLGIAQGLILYLGLTKILGLEVVHPVETLLLMFTASLAFIGINAFLTTVFGKVGNFLSLILLVAQLGSAGGTYPLALSPKIFQILNPFLPISHAVFGLRQSISIGDEPFQQIFILLGFAIVFAIFNYARFARLHYGKLKTKEA